VKQHPTRTLIVWALLISLCTVVGSQSAEATTTVVNFSYTGAAQTWTVPAGISTIQFRVIGATGGTSWSNHGGYGESITGTLTVTPGETLQINVGQQGSGHSSGNNASAFNGGGSGFYVGAGGGGASDIRRSTYALANRVVVAGGGGGAGYYVGANAGFTTGDTGGDAGLDPGSGMNAGGGGGGTQSAGGAGGATSSICGGAGASGSPGVGGNGSATSAGGGGGGGGYYGGGGGGAGCNATSGGGGSSYIHPTLVTNSSNSLNTTVSHGSVMISYTVVTLATITLSAISGTPAAYRKSLTIRATASSAGRLTFYANGKRIPGCISRTVTTSFDCTFKPSSRGAVSIYSSFIPSTNDELANRSSVMTLLLGSRPTLR
jgi:hypothetical protein